MSTDINPELDGGEDPTRRVLRVTEEPDPLRAAAQALIDGIGFYEVPEDGGTGVSWPVDRTGEASPEADALALALRAALAAKDAER
jgi:hypothetical protein